MPGAPADLFAEPSDKEVTSDRSEPPYGEGDWTGNAEQETVGRLPECGADPFAVGILAARRFLASREI